MENMTVYNAYRAVPDEAKKTIKGGNINGFTDINPMWRIQCLTEEFGPCGVGWYTEITKQWIEPGTDGKVAAFCNIDLYVKYGGEWSKPIVGTGGSCFVNQFKGAPATSDEAYKMAYTDAISVACKALGFGADVYWSTGQTKYGAAADNSALNRVETNITDVIGDVMAQSLRNVFANNGIDEAKVTKAYKISRLEDLPIKSHNAVIKKIDKAKETWPMEHPGNTPALQG